MTRMLALIPLALFLGCSEYVIPAEHVSAGNTSVQKADQADFSHSPDAASRLALAKEELATARKLQATGDGRGADLMYLRADADARLAMATAQQQSIAFEAQQVRDQARQLRTATQAASQEK